MNTSKLTVGEIAVVEKLSGQGIFMMDDPTAPKGEMLAALAYVVKKRENPEFKHDEARKMTIEEIMEIIGGEEVEEDGDEDDPKAQ